MKNHALINQLDVWQRKGHFADYSRAFSSLFCFMQEISFDVFLQVVWLDNRIKPSNILGHKNYIELTVDQRNAIWVPDLYIRQLREMKVLKVFEEISSLRIYENSTISLSIGATIIIKCDMDFVLYPLDVQKCPVDFSSCKQRRGTTTWNVNFNTFSCFRQIHS